MAEYLPQILKYSVETQRISNHLPYHSKIRRERASVGQELINAIFGGHGLDIRKQLIETLRDKFLKTASLDQPDIHFKASLGSGFDMAIPDDTVNLLKNSSFEVWTNECRLPDWWFYWGERHIEVDTCGIIGNRCLRIDHPGGATSVGTLQQLPQVTDTHAYQQEASKLISLGENPFKAGTKLVASVWYKTSYTAGGATDFDLTLSYTDRNGTLHEELEPLVQNTNDRWRRATLTFMLPVDCNTVNIGVDFSGITGGTTVYIDAFQLEVGESATRWQPYVLDKPFYLDIIGVYDPPSAVSEYGDRAQYTESTEDFWYNCPTRLSLLSSIPAEDTDPGRAGFEYEIDFHKDSWTVEWTTDGQYIRKMGVTEEAADQYGRYVLAPYTYDGKFDDETWVFTYHALTYYQDKLWVIATGTNWKSASRMYLCVVDPLTVWPEPYHLDTHTVIELLDWSGGTPLRVEFKLEDQQHIYITTADTTYCYRLYYDYFMLSGKSMEVYFRENYGEVSVTPAASIPREESLTVKRQ